MKLTPKYKFLAILTFCLIHIFRDHLQIKGVKNEFTTIGHVWDSRVHEKDGMLVLGLIAALALYFYERDEEIEEDQKHAHRKNYLR